MKISTAFTINDTQAVRLPSELCFPESVKQVSICALGNERIITPLTGTWDSFFINGPESSADFIGDLQSAWRQKLNEH